MCWFAAVCAGLKLAYMPSSFVAVVCTATRVLLKCSFTHAELFVSVPCCSGSAAEC